MIAQHHTAAKMLAAAVLDLFPDTLLLGGQGTSQYFFYDFLFPFEFQEHITKMIEERMRLLLKERPSIRIMEMLPMNAASLLEHHSQTLLADQVMNLDAALVQMCEIGAFVDYCPYDLRERLPDPFYIKLLEAFDLRVEEGKITRIVGAASCHKEELKAVVKQSSSFAKKNHAALAVEQRFFFPLKKEGGWVFQPKAEALRNSLLRWWRQQLSLQGIDQIVTPLNDQKTPPSLQLTERHVEYFFESNLGKEAKLAELFTVIDPDKGEVQNGLLAPGQWHTERTHLFCSEEKVLQECISSLQFILKLPKILDFEFQILLCHSKDGVRGRAGKAVEFLSNALKKAGLDSVTEKKYRIGFDAAIEIQIADSLGRWWTISFLGIADASLMKRSEKGDLWLLVCSSFDSFERIIALLLEKREGDLPFWLAPEQLRFMVVNQKAVEYAEQIRSHVIQRGIRANIDSGDGKLSTRYYRAAQDKVPLVAIIGEREEKTQTITLRMNGSGEDRCLEVQAFYKMLEDLDIGIGGKDSELEN